jgi:hypothetical protein
MAEIVQTLFGISPESYQQQQSALADKRAMEYAKLDPFEQANYAIGRGAYGLAGAIGGALGGQDPELQLISARNSIAKQINFSDLNSIKQGIQMLGDAGDTVGMMQLADVYRKAQESGALVTQRQREALTPEQRNSDAYAKQFGVPGSLEYQTAFKQKFDELISKPGTSIYSTIDPSKYTPASLALFEKSGLRSDLVAITPKENLYAAINPSDYTPASIAAFEASGKRSDLVAKAPKGDKIFTNLNPADYTSDSIKAFVISGDYSDLVAKEKSTKTESTIGKVDPDKFTAASIAKFAKSNNFEDLVLIKPPSGGEKMPTGSVNVLDPKDPTGKKVIVVTAERAIKEGLVPFTSLPKEGGPTEGERKAATLLQRLQFSEEQLLTALGEDPKAAKPGLLASAVAKVSDPAANLLTSEARQRVESAQLDILDAALTLGTGAAYTNEQLIGYRKAYFPQIGDKPNQIKDKQARLENIIKAAKIAAGRAEKLVSPATNATPQGTDGFKYLGKEGKK